MNGDRHFRGALPGRLSYGFIGGLLTFFFVGTFLRLYQLPRQILAGDEWHAIHAAVRSGYLQIFSDFGGGGHSIPMAFYNKFLIDTIGLSENTLYAPFALFGILMILVVPLISRKFIRERDAVILALLISLSPLLIFYSRFARPYGLMALFGFLAVYFFHSWMTGTRSRKSFFLYVLFATLTVYLNIVALPFVFGPLLFYSAVLLYKKQNRNLKTAGSLIKTFALALLPTVVLLALPLANSLHAITGKANQTAIPFSTIIDSFQILTGSRNTLFSLVSLAFLFLGISWNLGKPENRGFAMYAIFLSLVQVVFVLIARPLGADAGHIFSRYIITVEPFLLFFIAAGIGYTVKKLKKAIPVVFIALFLFYWHFCIPSVMFQYNNSTQIYLLGQLLYGEDVGQHLFRDVIRRKPEFYLALKSYAPGTVSLVEVPYHPDGYYIYAYQLLHHQKVSMGFVDGLCASDRWGEIPPGTKNVSFHNFVYLADVNQLLTKKVDFVVFHKNLQDEVSVTVEHQHLDLSKCIEQYQRWFGEPYFQDADITVFRVHRQGSP